MTEPDIRTLLDNAVQLAATTKSDDRYAVQRALGHLAEALRAARAAIVERDEQLDLVTAPERNAAAELLATRKELEAARERIARLEQELAMARQEREIEDRVHDEDRRRLKELEKRAKRFDRVLMDDDAAFDRFMEQALDEHEKKHGRPDRR